ncbi:MAG: hypothetical protein D6710_06520 [Nitrospirae bacterium]|nr:MAG: hypothetical protein D6710_06520 [Nitrospirota bacterium]
MKRFVADCMLGRLARWMRYLGYDVLYFRDIEDRELVRIARAENRVLLTRDRGITRRFSLEHYLVKHEDIDSQIREILEVFPPEESQRSRCLLCNEVLLEVSNREDLMGRVPEYILNHHRQFQQCPSCGRVYWEGTHYKRMEERLSQICS